MNFSSNPYFTIIEKIDLLQRWILTHSIIYYILDRKVVHDNVFDKNCNHLILMKLNYPIEYKKSRYYQTFIEFDGSTGYGLPYSLKEIDKDKYNIIFSDAMRLVRHYCKD